MRSKKLLIAAMLGCAVAVTSTFPGSATTVAKIMTNEAYVGTSVTLQGKITEHYTDDMYKLVDYNGDFIRIDLGKCGVVSANHPLSATGILRVIDNTLVLDATAISYDQEANWQTANHNTMNDNNYPISDYTKTSIHKLLSGSQYMGKRVALTGQVYEMLGNDYAQFRDTNGERVIVRLNYHQITTGQTVTIYGVPQIANNRLEISLERVQ